MFRRITCSSGLGYARQRLSSAVSMAAAAELRSRLVRAHGPNLGAVRQARKRYRTAQRANPDAQA